jgi:hypothetical protein
MSKIQATIVFLIITLFFVVGCNSNQNFIRPSDVLIDKTSLIGTTGNVGGHLACSNDLCTINESTRGMVINGSRVFVKINTLSREDRRFVIQHCAIDDPCQLVVTGEFIQHGIEVGIQAKKIEKLGITKLVSDIENKLKS